VTKKLLGACSFCRRGGICHMTSLFVGRLIVLSRIKHDY
jgi:hypothetical protein